MSIQPSELLHAPVVGTLVPGGATFRVWAPRAHAVHVSGDFNGWTHDTSSRMAPIGSGHWASFVPGLKDDDSYLFYVEGTGLSDFKRDPRARLPTTFQPAFPSCNSVLRNAAGFPWHQVQFTPPAFNDLTLYQLHVGTYAIAPGNGDGRFLDVIQRVPYLASLGVNAIALLPIQEFPTMFSMGYNGTDLYSPENQYAETDAAWLQRYFDLTNAILRQAGQIPYGSTDVLRRSDDQLRALIDVCHVYGLMLFMGQGSGGRAAERHARRRHVNSMGRARSRRQDTRRFPAFYARTDRPDWRHCEERAARSITCMTKTACWRSSVGSRARAPMSWWSAA